MQMRKFQTENPSYDYLEKGPNYINSLLNVLMAWRYNDVGYTGDWRVFNRFLWRSNENRMSKVYKWKRINFSDKPAADIAAGAIMTLSRAS